MPLPGRRRRLPAGLRERAAPRREVARHDRAHALGLEHQDDPEAHRPASDHDRNLLPADLTAAHGVPGHGHRLRQRGNVGWQAVWHRQHERFLGEQLLGVGARRMDGQADGVDTLVRSDERQRHDGRPGRHLTLAPRAVLGHLA